MDSDDDDVPLAGKQSNGVKSKERISDAMDISMDNSTRNGHSSAIAAPAISLSNGPIEKNSSKHTNGKRKSRTHSNTYKDISDSDGEDLPLSKKQKIVSTKKPVDDSDSDAPLATKKAVKPPRASAAQIGESSDDGVQLGQKLAQEKDHIQKEAAKEAKKLRADDAKKAKQSNDDKKKQTQSSAKRVKQEDSDDDIPLKNKAMKLKKEDSDDDKPLKPKAKTTKTKSEVDTVPKKGRSKVKQEQDEVDDDDAQAEEDEFRWWEDPGKGDGTKKWSTLEHNGVVFPPEYQPLPKNVKIKYDGIPVSLKPEAEEVAAFYGSMLHSTVNVENPTFNKNFFDDFKKVLSTTGHATDRDGKKIKIEKFEKCDFSPIYDHVVAEKAAKNNVPAAEKKAAKAAKDAIEAPFMYCLWDGRKQKVGNFRVEPPGLFRGRGEHPKTGRVKKRVLPEQITINIGKGATIPAPPEGHRWKEVKHDTEGTWLAMWQENINGAYKYVMLAANSDVKGQSDWKKFEKARELKKHIDIIREDYTNELKTKVMADRQRATAIYLIDQIALRAGNEKGDDEADTVGCCSLKYEHITLEPPNKVKFDFLGKDSIRFEQEVMVSDQVFKNLGIFKKGKNQGDEVFDRLTTSALNKHLQGYMTGLTAKVFRTYNASNTMAMLLKKMKVTGTVPEKVKDYNDANREVAIICNHKRTVAAGHDGQMEKMEDKINGLRYQQWRIKQMMLGVEPKIKKSKGAVFFELPEDLDPEWIEEHQAALVAQERTKIEKKFEKENEKLVAEGEKEMKQKELQGRLEVADDLEKKYKKENKTKKVEPEGKGPSVDRYEGQIEKLDQRVETMKVQAADKDNNKEVALGTSKINYIDPRLTVVFSKKFNVPIERFFSKTLREKFDWAIKSADEDWDF